MLPVKGQFASIKRRLINYLKDWGDDITRYLTKVEWDLVRARGLWGKGKGGSFWNVKVIPFNVVDSGFHMINNG